jgi:hypothetical protein
MGSLYDATVEWRDGMRLLRRRDATIPEKGVARQDVRIAFEKMFDAMLDDSAWDARDQKAWDYLERLDAEGQ